MKFRRLTVETLENRTLLAANVLSHDTLPVDANTHGVFDKSEIVAGPQAAKDRTGEPATWREADWNIDRVFDELGFDQKQGSLKSVPFKSNSFSGISIPLKICDDGLYLMQLEGVGQVTHMGKVTWLSTHFLDFATGLYSGGTAVLTAANGDELHATYYGQVNPLESTWIEYETWSGGTGRFADAVGESVTRGPVDLTQVPLTWTCTTDGRISY